MDGFFTKEYLDMFGSQMYEMTVKEMGKEIIEEKVMKEMTHQAFKQCLIQSMKSRLHNQIEIYLDSEEFLNKNPVFKAEKERADKLITRYIFLTVNPEPSITLKTALQVINKCCAKIWMKNYLYVIEQRGIKDGDNMGNGFHIHFIIDTENGKKRHETIRELKNTFKKICIVDKHNIFNIRNIKEKDLMNFIKYITGKKKDEIKHEKQIADRKWRKDNNIEPLYGMGELMEMYNDNKESIEDFDYNF